MGSSQCYKNLNKLLVNSPVPQLNPSAQIRRIDRSVKFISVIDLSSAYWTLCIDKKSSFMTGFHSGISSLGSFIYSRVPMGLKVSQNLLNASLIHIFSTINDVMLYSDNI